MTFVLLKNVSDIPSSIIAGASVFFLPLKSIKTISNFRMKKGLRAMVGTMRKRGRKREQEEEAGKEKDKEEGTGRARSALRFRERSQPIRPVISQNGLLE